MNITTTQRHCELSAEDRLFAQQRLEKLSRFTRDIMEMHLIVTAEKYRYSAEITLKLKRRELVSREEADDARTAIDLTTERLEHQIRRIKEKRLDRKRGDRTRIADGAAPPGAVEDEYGEGAA